MSWSRGEDMKITFEQALTERYLSYALSTIVSRSLPDVRDGLKPVHRRLLYAMGELHLLPSSKAKKSASVVGFTMMKFHPHGDAAIYQTLVRLAQDFSLRFPLIEGQGNFGNIDGDGAAAMRYTEARLTPLGHLMLDGLGENGSSFQKTFDGETDEPSVLPGCFPHLLANGSTGIAVGMATSIPPHNLHEICDALIHLLYHENATISDLCAFVKGPDFPTGGEIIDSNTTISNIYETGKGVLKLRGIIQKETMKNGQWCLVITEIPYMIEKSKLIEKIADLILQKKIPDLIDIQDESQDFIRIVLSVKSKNVNAEMVMEQLYQLSDLQISFPINLNALDRGVPRVMNLKELLKGFLDHQKDVSIKRASFNLKKTNDRLEILNGYLIVYDHLDEVIRIIREDDHPERTLANRFNLTDNQVDAILNMRLKSLKALQQQDIKKEHDTLVKTKESLEKFLSSKTLQHKKIEHSLKDLIKKYGKDTDLGKRRTVFNEKLPLSLPKIEDAIPDEPIVFILSKHHWVGIDKTDDIKYKEGDEGHFVIHGNMKDFAIIATSSGRFYTLPVYKLPKHKQAELLRLLIDMDPKDEVVNVLLLPTDLLDKHAIIVLKEGKGFKVQGEQLLSYTKMGKQIATGEVVNVLWEQDHQDVLLLGHNRRMIILKIDDIPTLKKGQGVNLLKATIVYANLVYTREPLVWMRGERSYKIADFRPWQLKRGSAGRLAPIGFFRN